MLEPIVKSIDVPCPPERAFAVFVNDMGTWWPIDKRSMSMAFSRQPAKSLRIEPKLGGRIVETGHDGKEHHWGTIRAFDPPALVRMDFHMGMPPDMASQLEVRFSPLPGGKTRVQLTHRNFEAFGEMAAMNYGGYTSGWVIIFEQAYKAACGG